jgi:hypothetical protein
MWFRLKSELTVVNAVMKGLRKKQGILLLVEQLIFSFLIQKCTPVVKKLELFSK